MTSQNAHGKSVFLEVLTQDNYCTVVVIMSMPDKLYSGVAKPGKVATSPELPHPSRAAQLEPSGTKQERSQHAVNNTCIATWSQVEPGQRAVNNTCAATWNQMEPSGTKPGTKQNFNPSYAKRTVLVTSPSPFYNTK